VSAEGGARSGWARVAMLERGDVELHRGEVDQAEVVGRCRSQRRHRLEIATAATASIDAGRDPGQLSAVAFCGGNLIPIGGDFASWTVLGRHLANRRRACSSIVGPASAVAILWPSLSRRWGTARMIRASQPLLVTDRVPAVPIDPAVRPANFEDVGRYLPAAFAMFEEELGLTPADSVDRPGYRVRLTQLIAAGHALVRLDDRGAVLFKAELAAVSSQCCQVQGVWVRPDMRGRGVGTAAMAAVIDYALQLAPRVSLYVNDFNYPARRLYGRLGMRQIGTLSTVLF